MPENRKAHVRDGKVVNENVETSGFQTWTRVPANANRDAPFPAVLRHGPNDLDIDPILDVVAQIVVDTVVLELLCQHLSSPVIELQGHKGRV